MFGVLILGMRGFTYPQNSESLEHISEAICLAVSFCGLGIRIYAIGHAPRGTSGRSTEKQEADSLNTTGLYSIVRHPLYLGNFLIWFGISLVARQWWVTTISTLTFWLYYERIMAAEEHFLKENFGKEFERWAISTPAFLPRIAGWKKSAFSFSPRSVLRREYGGFFAIILVFSALNSATHFIVDGEFHIEPFWGVLTLGGFLSYVVLHALKKKSTLLDPPAPDEGQPPQERESNDTGISVG